DQSRSPSNLHENSSYRPPTNSPMLIQSIVLTRASAIFLRRVSPRIAQESLFTRYHPQRSIQPAIFIAERNVCGYARRLRAH
ncbi:MAG: hypothetical protein AB7U61_10510, partial [Methylocystis sp.]